VWFISELFPQDFVTPDFQVINHTSEIATSLQAKDQTFEKILSLKRAENLAVAVFQVVDPSLSKSSVQTATLLKHEDGSWKLYSLHCSSY
jgi:hypothetical protein